MSDTIALVGRSPSGRAYLDSIPDDVKIYTIAACFDLPPRIDVCVEIHPYWVINNKNYARHMFDWLEQPHDFPIYMQEKHADIPASAVYPFEEVVKLSPVLRGKEDRPNRFLSSSFDYLMAMAILAKPKRIEVIGFDMASDTEYRYQREGAAFWIGLAAGRGIEIWIPDESPILEVDMLYGYEGAQAVTLDRLHELAENYANWTAEAEETHARASQLLPVVESDEIPKEIEAEYREVAGMRDLLNIYSGGAQTLQQLEEKFAVESIVYRQVLESQYAVALYQSQVTLSRLNWWQGTVTDRQDRLKRNSADPTNRAIFMGELKEAYRSVVQARDEFVVWKGSLQLIRQLIRECDFKYDDEWKPILETTEETVEVV